MRCSFYRKHSAYSLSSMQQVVLFHRLIKSRLSKLVMPELACRKTPMQALPHFLERGALSKRLARIELINLPENT